MTEPADLLGGARAAQTRCAASRRRGGNFLCCWACVAACVYVCVCINVAIQLVSAVRKLGQTGVHLGLLKRIYTEDQTHGAYCPVFPFQRCGIVCLLQCFLSKMAKLCSGCRFVCWNFVKLTVFILSWSLLAVKTRWCGGGKCVNLHGKHIQSA